MHKFFRPVKPNQLGKRPHMVKKTSALLCTLGLATMIFGSSVSTENNNNYNDQNVDNNYDVRNTAANNAYR